MGQEDWAFEDIEETQKGRTMITVNVTHANDYLVSKRGTIGLSVHFFPL